MEKPDLIDRLMIATILLYGTWNAQPTLVSLTALAAPWAEHA
jgi:hypothetical protein